MNFLFGREHFPPSDGEAKLHVCLFWVAGYSSLANAFGQVQPKVQSSKLL